MKMIMENITVKSVALSCAFATILACLWTILNWVWWKPKKIEKYLRQQGFSGNSYNFFHGDVKEMAMMSKQSRTRTINIYDDITPQILPFHHHIITKYGKNSFMWFGPIASINITDPKLIREILYKREIFQKPKSNSLGKLLVNGMVVYEGDQWLKVRKIANPAFHMDKLKDMLPKIHSSCEDMISKWRILISNKESCELDVWPHIKTLTADVISRTAFGSSYQDGRKTFQLISEQMNLMSQSMQFIHIPGWRFVPTKVNRKLKSNHNEMREVIKGLIKKREEALKDGEASSDDLLGMLIESNHKVIQEHRSKENGISVEEVIEECKLFYIAGQETTAVLIVWTIILLCIHPDWQERAREEVFKVFGNGNKDPGFEELNHLKEINKILQEALRLYPPAPLLNRTSTKQTKLGELSVPAGVQLSIPTILVHRDEQHWGDDAKKFNPDRFSEGVSKASKSQLSFIPFGWGPRICIGQNFALIEAKLTIAMILKTFSFKLSPAYIHAPARSLTPQPQHGAPIILHKIW